jgi:hypothetical protein
MSSIGARVLRTFTARQTYLPPVETSHGDWNTVSCGLAVTPLAILLLHLRELGTLKFAIRFWGHPVSLKRRKRLHFLLNCEAALL